MNLTTEQLEQILEGAPEGASDVLLDHEWNQTYIKKKKDSWLWYKPDQSYWFQFDNMPTMQTIHNLSDLRAILDQAREIERLREALEWISRVNAMDYEYVAVAKEALKE